MFCCVEKAGRSIINGYIGFIVRRGSIFAGSRTGSVPEGISD
jgi:hypothetical protein